jgi:hypothetical protein
MSTELAVRPATQVARVGDRGIQLGSVGDLLALSAQIAASGLAPRGLETKEKVFVAIQMGMELGLSPMVSLRTIAVINGRPCLWGDGAMGLVSGSGQLESIHETASGEGENYTATCTVKRKGRPEASASFSVADAKRANLWGKAGPWQQYPKRMLQMRARGFALRDVFADVLQGLMTSDEAADIEPVETAPAEVSSGEPVIAKPVSLDDLDEGAADVAASDPAPGTPDEAEQTPVVEEAPKEEDVKQGEIDADAAFGIHVGEALESRGIASDRKTGPGRTVYAAIRKRLKVSALLNLDADERKQLLADIAAGNYDDLKKESK